MLKARQLIALTSVLLASTACCSLSTLTSSQRRDIRWRERITKDTYGTAQTLISNQGAEGALLALPAQRPPVPNDFKISELLPGKSAVDAALTGTGGSLQAFDRLSRDKVCIWIPKASQSMEPFAQPCALLREEVGRILGTKAALTELNNRNMEILAQITVVSQRTDKIDDAVKEQRESLSRVAAGLTTALGLAMVNDKRLDTVSEQVEESIKAFQESSNRLQELMTGTAALAAVLKNHQADLDAKLKQVLDTVKAIR